MNYEIEVDFTTGNSFDSERTTDTVGAIWFSLKTAKVALQHIKEHYEAVKAYELADSSRNRFRKEYTFDIKDYEDKPWFDEETAWHCCLKVPVDNGEPQLISAFWIGYFEALHGAKIITTGDTDMEFTTK